MDYKRLLLLVGFIIGLTLVVWVLSYGLPRLVTNTTLQSIIYFFIILTATVAFLSQFSSILNFLGITLDGAVFDKRDIQIEFFDDPQAVEQCHVEILRTKVEYRSWKWNELPSNIRPQIEKYFHDAGVTEELWPQEIEYMKGYSRYDPVLIIRLTNHSKKYISMKELIIELEQISILEQDSHIDTTVHYSIPISVPYHAEVDPEKEHQKISIRVNEGLDKESDARFAVILHHRKSNLNYKQIRYVMKLTLVFNRERRKELGRKVIWIRNGNKPSDLLSGNLITHALPVPLDRIIGE